MGTTTIEWTEETWNPVTGCSKVSPGCAHCYAEGVANRFWPKQYAHHGDRFVLAANVRLDAKPPGRVRQFTDVMTHEDRLDQPLRWKKPRKIFVNSMSDLFHEDVPDAFIDRVFAVMALAPQHTFQVLTKRAERMRDYLANDLVIQPRIARAQSIIAGRSTPECGWPLPNVWLGVSCENQHFADERIWPLLRTPAAVRFISAEPLLKGLDLERIGHDENCGGALNALTGEFWIENWHDNVGTTRSREVVGSGARLDWVIVGGESGAGARPFDVAWPRSIVAQCQAADVPVFVKQFGADPRGWCGWPHHDECPPKMLDEHGTLASVSGLPGTMQHALGDAFWPCSPKLRDRKGGDPEEWPEDLRVREMPGARS